MKPRRRLGEWLYALALRLYPRDFRERYARAMTDFQRERVRDARASGQTPLIIWLRALGDVVLSALAERLAEPAPKPRSTEEHKMRAIPADVGYALRGLVRRPMFTVVVVATIALGVGANAAIFSVVNGVLLRPLPYPAAERVISFGHAPPHWLTSESNFLDYRSEMRSFDGLSAFTQLEATITSGDEPERIRLVRASEDFFPVLGVAPMLGRVFAADEYRADPPTVVMLSHALWTRRFGADRAIVSRTISINGLARTVVGVMPPHFDYPQARTDLWTPLPQLHPDSLNGRDNNYLWMVGRLRPGVTIEHARSEANGIAGRIMRDYASFFNPREPLTPRLVAVGELLVGKTRPYLIALLGTVSFVLLIACANVANLLLARSESRRKEMAVRRALGASGRRLATQLFTESAMLAFAGGAFGLLIAWGGDSALVSLAPAAIPRLDQVRIDWKVAAFAIGASALTGLLIGLVPAWRASRGSSSEALKEGGRSVGMHGGARGARRVLVVAEVALAVVTLSGAGMLLRSLWHLEGNDLGFDPHNVLTAKVALAAREYDDTRAAVFYEQLLERLRALPGVRAAGAAGWLPVVDAGGLWGVRVEGRSYTMGSVPTAVPHHVTPGYFAAMGQRILAGRDFARSDRADAPYVAIVSSRFARTHWPGEDAIGQRFHVMGGNTPFMTVVGVVSDVRARGFDDTAEPTMYFPYDQAPKTAMYAPRAMALAVRADVTPMSLEGALRSSVRALDRTTPVSEVRTLADVVGTSVASRKFSTELLLAFAALALALAGIGTYGVISYGVSQRTYEIGVRMALGAERRTVLFLVLSEGMQMCLIGLGIGIVGSIAAATAIRAMLVGVSPVDVPTLALVCVVLMGVAVAASLLPAWRAMEVSPTEALRGT
jgi:putative ABC transport system permease protein